MIDVKVLNEKGEGTISGIISALNYISHQKRENPTIPMVANLSLSSDGPSPSVDAAIESAVQTGVVVVVAAGNKSMDACRAFLATAPNAIAVGATNIDDSRATFSNYGSCVDIFAPGYNIPSAWATSDHSQRVSSGTSMGKSIACRSLVVISKPHRMVIHSR